jgi:hypothetical protein
VGDQSISRYKRIYQQDRRDGGHMGIAQLAFAVGVSYDAAYAAARLLGLDCMRQEEATALSYRAAAVRVRIRDKHGVVTFWAIAEEREVTVETVHDFFERNPGLADAWQVCDRAQEKRARCIAAAAIFRDKHPDKVLYRKILADELGWPAATLYTYLNTNRDLVELLGIPYTYQKYGR